MKKDIRKNEMSKKTENLLIRYLDLARKQKGERLGYFFKSL